MRYRSSKKGRSGLVLNIFTLASLREIFFRSLVSPPVCVPTGVQPFSVPEHKELGNPSGGYRSLTFHLNLIQIPGVEHRRVTISLDLGFLEFEAYQFAAVGPKLSSVLEDLGLGIPMITTGIDCDSVGWEQFLECFDIPSEVRPPDQFTRTQQFSLIADACRNTGSN
jgi:hypothetical protein